MYRTARAQECKGIGKHENSGSQHQVGICEEILLESLKESLNSERIDPKMSQVRILIQYGAFKHLFVLTHPFRIHIYIIESVFVKQVRHHDNLSFLQVILSCVLVYVWTGRIGRRKDRVHIDVTEAGVNILFISLPSLDLVQ